jgi:hypothetical protein
MTSSYSRNIGALVGSAILSLSPLLLRSRTQPS